MCMYLFKEKKKKNIFIKKITSLKKSTKIWYMNITFFKITLNMVDGMV